VLCTSHLKETAAARLSLRGRCIGKKAAEKQSAHLAAAQGTRLTEKKKAAHLLS
jgi:hypothetical protein